MAGRNAIGSAWKYSLFLLSGGATPYYIGGRSCCRYRDYDKVLKNRIHDKSVPVSRDNLSATEEPHREEKDEVVQ